MLYKFIIKRSKLAVLLFACTCLLWSCQKNSELFVPDPGQPNGADTNWVSGVTGIMPIVALADSIALQPQTDSLSSNVRDTLLAGNGVMLVLPANTLENTGSAPVEGKVKAEFLALQKKGDLIRMYTPTVMDSAVLSTVGAFFILFTQNGTVLQVKSQATVQLSIPGPATAQSSSFFIGIQGQQGIYNWRRNADQLGNMLDFGNNAYVANINTLGWIAAGYPLQAASNRLQLSLPAQYTNANTRAFVVLNNHRSVVKMSDDLVQKKFYSIIIPTDQAATIVVLSKQGNDYFAATQNITSLPGTQTVSILPVKTSLAGIGQLLDAL